MRTTKEASVHAKKTYNLESGGIARRGAKPYILQVPEYTVQAAPSLQSQAYVSILVPPPRMAPGGELAQHIQALTKCSPGYPLYKGVQ